MSDSSLVVVTGGSAGIGLALARRLRSRAPRMLLIARSPERLKTAGRELQCETLSADLGDAVDRLRVVERLRNERRISLLVNNAGGPFRKRLLEHDPDEAADAITLLYLAMLETTAGAWPGLVATQGAVINVVSVAGTVATGSAPHYSAAKHAAIAWSRALHLEASTVGVHVLTTNPGPVATSAFPHDRLRMHRLLRHAVIDDQACANAIVRALDRRRAEAFQPEWWRIAAVAQAVAPATMARVARWGRDRFG